MTLVTLATIASIPSRSTSAGQQQRLETYSQQELSLVIVKERNQANDSSQNKGLRSQGKARSPTLLEGNGTRQVSKKAVSKF
jgi:hypothetical protein